MEEKMLTVFGYTIMSMDTFNFVAGIASIVGLIAAFCLGKSVINKKNNSNSTKQHIDAGGSVNVTINQAGRDIKK